MASINISNSHVTCSQVKRGSEILDKPEGKLLLPLQIGDSGNSEGTIPGATLSASLHFLILDSPQYITICDAGQHSTKMRCYFHYQCNCFIDYFDDAVSDAAVMCTGYMPFQYNEQRDMYTECFGKQTGNVFAASRSNELLLSHRGTASHVSHAPV